MKKLPARERHGHAHVRVSPIHSQVHERQVAHTATHADAQVTAKSSQAQSRQLGAPGQNRSGEE